MNQSNWKGFKEYDLLNFENLNIDHTVSLSNKQHSDEFRNSQAVIDQYGNIIFKSTELIQDKMASQNKNEKTECMNSVELKNEEVQKS